MAEITVTLEYNLADATALLSVFSDGEPFTTASLYQRNVTFGAAVQTEMPAGDWVVIDAIKDWNIRIQRTWDYPRYPRGEHFYSPKKTAEKIEAKFEVGSLEHTLEWIQATNLVETDAHEGGVFPWPDWWAFTEHLLRFQQAVRDWTRVR